MDAKYQLALARLDSDIAEMEAGLKDLRRRREGAEAFLTYMDAVADFAPETLTDEPSTFGLPQHVGASPSRARAGGATPKDVVMSVFERVPATVLTIDAVYEESRKDGSTLDRPQIRNGIHYAVRKGLLSKAGPRGSFILTDASAPAVTGAEETEGSNSDSSLVEGGPDESSEPLRVRTDHADSSHEDDDHVDLRAPIVGGSEAQ